MINWVVQSQVDERRQNVNARIKQACEQDGSNFTEVDIIPFERSIRGECNVDGPVVVYGSTAMNKLPQQMGWEPGIFPVWDEQVTKNRLGGLYFNWDMEEMDPQEVVSYVKEQGWEFFFVKPVSDIKTFDGMVTDCNKFPFLMERVSQYNGYDPTAKVCVSPIKHPIDEWRIVVVNGNISSGSRYRRNRQLSIEGGVPFEVWRFVTDIITFCGEPSPVYVIDVCSDIKGDLSVVEYNTFNHSGLYDCDVNQIVCDVNKYVRKHYE